MLMLSDMKLNVLHANIVTLSAMLGSKLAFGDDGHWLPLR
jgi:hypothetical protein